MKLADLQRIPQIDLLAPQLLLRVQHSNVVANALKNCTQGDCHAAVAEVHLKMQMTAPLSKAYSRRYQWWGRRPIAHNLADLALSSSPAWHFNGCLDLCLARCLP